MSATAAASATANAPAPARIEAINRTLRATSISAAVPTACTSRRRGAGCRSSASTPRERTGASTRHLMTDEAVTARYRVLAFDMPWHGKSFPPVGWRDEEYRLTSESYAEMIIAFCEGLAHRAAGGDGMLHRRAHGPLPRDSTIPSASGPSSGSRRPTSSPAAGTSSTGCTSRTSMGGRRARRSSRGSSARKAPTSTGGRRCGSTCRGGPGVFRGDLWFYRVDGDLREETHRIDVRKCPLYLLTGEYDFSLHPRGQPAHRGPPSRARR